MFNVVRNKDLEIIVTGIETGEEAALKANELSLSTGYKHSPRRAKALNQEDYKVRENRIRYNYQIPRCLIVSGERRSSAWYRRGKSPHFEYTLEYSDIIPYHYTRICPNEPLVQFFESEEKAQANILTKMKIGTYLKNYYAKFFTHDEITAIATEFNAEHGEQQFAIAYTPDEIERVFRNCPWSSCAHFSNWDSNKEGAEHPARVYAGGDIGVAYTINPAGRTTGRAMVHEGRKLRTPIYGTSPNFLKHKLEELKFKESRLGSDWDGLRLRKIMKKDIYVGCHIDYFPIFTDKGDHLVVDHKKGTLGFFSAQPYASGFAETTRSHYTQPGWF